uniref:Pleckstrin homology domain-containing family M member 2 isoform X1 n=1 Tax=Petromyzon marinus TaxID=7757 RepID=A0AAJ7TNF6_PETMA|nr:pleckstrin homology domain-containing family M member 2 isoform X1 [Petromyzon marinus]
MEGVKLKDRILENISWSIKKLQGSFVPCQREEEEDVSVGSQPTVRNHDRLLHRVCEHLDHALLHGLQHIPAGYWPLVMHFTRSDAVATISALHHVTTSLGRSRAWLYLALNESSLESYLRLFSENPVLLRSHYSGSALVCSSDHLNLFLTLVSGLEFIHFELELDAPYLDLAAYMPDPYRPVLPDDLHGHSPSCRGSCQGGSCQGGCSDSASLESGNSANLEWDDSAIAPSSEDFDFQDVFEPCMCVTDATADTDSLAEPLHSPDAAGIVGTMGTTGTTAAKREREGGVTAAQRGSWHRQNPFSSPNLGLRGDPTDEVGGRAIPASSGDADHDHSPLEVIRLTTRRRKRHDNGRARGADGQRHGSGGGSEAETALQPDIVLQWDAVKRPSSALQPDVILQPSALRQAGKAGEAGELGGAKEPGDESQPDTAQRVDTEPWQVGLVSGSEQRGANRPGLEMSRAKGPVQSRNLRLNIANPLNDDEGAERVGCRGNGDAEEEEEGEGEQHQSVHVLLSSHLSSAQRYTLAHTDEEQWTLGDDAVDSDGVRPSEDGHLDKLHNHTEHNRPSGVASSVDCYGERGCGADDGCAGDCRCQNGNCAHDCGGTGHRDNVEAENGTALTGDRDADGEDTETDDAAMGRPLQHRAEISVDNNLLLLLMLHVFREDEEQLYKMLKLTTGHAEGAVRSLFVVLTDCHVYLVRKGTAEKPFAVERATPYHQLAAVRVGVHGQAVRLDDASQRQHTWIDTAEHGLTEFLLLSLTAALVRGCREPPYPRTHTETSETHPTLMAFVARETPCPLSEVHVACYSYVHWEEVHQQCAPGSGCAAAGCLQASRCPQGPGCVPYKEELLVYRTTGRMGGHTWKPCYLVLSSGILYQYEDSTGVTPLMSLSMSGGGCGGCLRVRDAEQPHSFQVLLTGRPPLRLAARSEPSVSHWLQAICQAVSHGVCVRVPAVPGVLLLTRNDLFLCHEDAETRFIRSLGRLPLPCIVRARTHDMRHACSLVREGADSQCVLGWDLSFSCDSELRRFLSGLALAWESIFQVPLPQEVQRDGS